MIISNQQKIFIHRQNISKLHLITQCGKLSHSLIQLYIQQAFKKHCNNMSFLSIFLIISFIIIIIMPKLWLTLFIGYNGSPFNGMQFQIQSNINTIQGALAEKLHKNGFLMTTNHSNLQRNQRWSRAARTDKGVHAIINAVSCQFTIDDIYFHQDKTLNKNHLDLAFRQALQGSELIYHGFKRVTTRFQIRYMVKSRYYSYLCPKILINQNEEYNPPVQTSQKTQKRQEQTVIKSSQQKQQAVKDKQSQINQSNIKIQQQILKKLNDCCKQFVGTHNFHNYSKNLKAKDAQAQRYILSFKCSQYNKDYYLFEIQGQSFIYHQIRKMVGCIIMVMANNYQSSFIQNTFFRNQIHMPVAPAQGLFLKGLNFDAYNKKKDIPQQLTFDNMPSIETFKEEITNYITEKDLSPWREWLKKLKESIYYGIVFEQQDKHEGKQINDD